MVLQATLKNRYEYLTATLNRGAVVVVVVVSVVARFAITMLGYNSERDPIAPRLSQGLHLSMRLPSGCFSSLGMWVLWKTRRIGLGLTCSLIQSLRLYNLLFTPGFLVSTT